MSTIVDSRCTFGLGSVTMVKGWHCMGDKEVKRT